MKLTFKQFENNQRKHCPAEDDFGTACTNVMTEEEQKQDGMCSCCANAIWDSLQSNKPFRLIRHEGLSLSAQR